MKLTDDTDGAVVSMVTVNPDDVDVTVESDRIAVDCAVITLSPAVSTPVVHSHSPVVELAGHVLPVSAPSANSCTVEPTGAEPVNVRVVDDVIASVFTPVFVESLRTGVETSGTA